MSSKKNHWRGLEGDGFPVLKRDSRAWATRYSCSISVTYVTYTMILLVKRPFHLTEAILVVIAHQWWNLLESRDEIPLVRRQSLLRKNTSRSLIFVGKSPISYPCRHVSVAAFEIHQLYQNSGISMHHFVVFCTPEIPKVWWKSPKRSAPSSMTVPSSKPSQENTAGSWSRSQKKVWLTKKALGCSGDMDMFYVYCLVISLAIGWCIHGILLYHLFKISWNLCKYVCIEIERGREKERKRERGR